MLRKLIFLLTATNGIVHWLEENMLTCPSKKFLHIECPGCGFQRSCIALFKGNLLSSLQFYPATIPVFFLLVFTMLHLKYDFARGATILKYLQAGTAIVILLFYIYKILNHKIIA